MARGRKWFDGKEEQLILGKLEEAFAIGCTNREACLYSDITEDMFYNYIKQNPELTKRFSLLKEKPILKARHTVVKGLDEPEHAKWYLSRKRKDEFADRELPEGQTNIQINYYTDGQAKRIAERALRPGETESSGASD